MKVSDAFPSNYLKAADLDGKPALAVIEKVEFEKIGDDKKMIVYFQHKDKGMVCNKTNANTIAALYGDDTDDWQGREIVLFEAYVDFQGKSVPAIRVRAPKKRTAAPPPQQRQTREQPRQRGDSDDELDDSIPF